MVILLDDPFPHVICYDFFTESELKLICSELNFLTAPNKLLPPGIHHASPDKDSMTKSRALCLEKAYTIPEISDILQITKKVLDPPFVSTICTKWKSFLRLRYITNIETKVRYYHNGDGYEPHTDILQDFLGFAYIHTLPKKFKGGEIYFPEYNYELECEHNSFVLLPSYVEHGVRPVSIEEDDYYNGNGRYCISQFFNMKNS